MKKLLLLMLLFVATVSHGQHYEMFVVPNENYKSSIKDNLFQLYSNYDTLELSIFKVKVIDSYYLDIHEMTSENERIRFYGRISKNIEENTFTLDDMISGRVYKMVITDDGEFFYLDDLRSERYFFKFIKSK